MECGSDFCGDKAWVDVARLSTIINQAIFHPRGRDSNSLDDSNISDPDSITLSLGEHYLTSIRCLDCCVKFWVLERRCPVVWTLDFIILLLKYLGNWIKGALCLIGVHYFWKRELNSKQRADFHTHSCTHVTWHQHWPCLVSSCAHEQVSGVIHKLLHAIPTMREQYAQLNKGLTISSRTDARLDTVLVLPRPRLQCLCENKRSMNSSSFYWFWHQ